MTNVVADWRSSHLSGSCTYYGGSDGDLYGNSLVIKCTDHEGNETYFMAGVACWPKSNVKYDDFIAEDNSSITIENSTVYFKTGEIYSPTTRIYYHTVTPDMFRKKGFIKLSEFTFDFACKKIAEKLEKAPQPVDKNINRMNEGLSELFEEYGELDEITDFDEAYNKIMADFKKKYVSSGAVELEYTDLNIKCSTKVKDDFVDFNGNVYQDWDEHE